MGCLKAADACQSTARIIDQRDRFISVIPTKGLEERRHRTVSQKVFNKWPTKRADSFSQARRNVFVSGGYGFVRTLYNLVVKVVCLKFFDISRIFDLGGTRGTNPELGGTMYPPVPIVPTPLVFVKYHTLVILKSIY